MMLINLTQDQVNIGIEPTICSIGEPDVLEKPLETEALKKGFKVKKFRMRAGPNIMGALKILKFAHEEHFDLLHTHGYKADILFGFIPKIVRKIPLVATLHGWTSTDRVTRIKIYKWLDLESLKYFDSVVLVNKAMLSDKKIRGKKGIRRSVVYNGIPLLNFNDHSYSDSAYITESPKEKIVPETELVEFCKEGFIVGSIGRLSTEKGFEYLIEAIHILRQKSLKVRLVIIGEGDKRSDLLKVIGRLNISSDVLLPGYLSNACQYLPLFNVFVLSSLTEGLPITLLEAMQTRIPIVATNVGGIPEVLEDGKGGLLVEPKKPEAIAEAILNIYNHPEFSEQFVNFSYNEVITKYSSRTMALNYADVYRKVTKIHTDDIRREL